MEQIDPRVLGARCDECVLRGQRPVLGAGPVGTGFVVVGEAPGEQEEIHGTPFVGPAGRMLDAALQRAGLPRKDVHVTNVLCCRPTRQRTFDQLLKDIARENRATSKAHDRTIRSFERARIRHGKQLDKWRARCARLEERHAQAVERAQIRYEKACATALRRNAWAAAKGRPPEIDLPAPPVPPTLTLPPPPPQPPTPPPPSPSVDAGAEGSSLVLSPVECCRPRLERELAQARTLLLVGGQALRAVTGRESIMEEQGAPIRLPDRLAPRWAVAVIHPAAILRGLLELHGAFYLWVGKAVRLHARGEVRWKDPSPYYTGFRVEHALRELLAEADRRRCAGQPPVDVAVDVETDGLDPVQSVLRCVGLAWGTLSAVVAFHSVDDGWIGHVGAIAALKDVLVHPHVCKIMHNGAFDRTVIQSHVVRVEGPGDDTMLAHHAIESEVPHTLAFVSSIVLDDAPAWKSLGDGTHGVTLESDTQLWLYNAIDAHRTLRAMEALRPVLATDGLEAVYRQAVELQPIVADMTVRGLCLDLERRDEIRVRLREHLVRCEGEMLLALWAELAVCTDAALAQIGLRYVHDRRDDGFVEVTKGRKNPKTQHVWPTLQVRRWHPQKQVDVWEPWCYTRPAHVEAVQHLLGIAEVVAASGKQQRVSRKADDLARGIPHMRPAARAFVGSKLSVSHDGNGYLGAMSAAKAASTFCDVTPTADGRIRVTWKQTGSVTGRWSSASMGATRGSGGNMQNQPEWIRRMYRAPAGCKLVGADYSALELWIVAVYTQARNLLAALRSADVHRQNCEALFGLRFADELAVAARRGCSAHGPLDPVLEDAGKKFKASWPGVDCPACLEAAQAVFDRKMEDLYRLRVQAKRFVYNANYEGGEETIWQKLLVEFPDLQLSTVVALLAQWRRMNPEIGARARQNHALYFRRRLKEGVGYLESPIMGRRRYWTGKEFGLPDAANYPIQSGGADVINIALLRLYDRARALGAYLIAQVHDSLLFEVPEENADALKALLEEVMPGPVRMRDLDGEWYFPVEVKIGYYWNEV